MSGDRSTAVVKNTYDDHHENGAYASLGEAKKESLRV